MDLLLVSVRGMLLLKSPWMFDVNGNRGFGGNARNWYANAKAAGYKVGQTPRVGAIIVYSALRSLTNFISSRFSISIPVSCISSKTSITIHIKHPRRFNSSIPRTETSSKSI